MNFRSDGFDWDDGNRTKCAKHGVSVAVIETLFSRPIAIEPDPSEREQRFRAVGRTAAGRPVFVVFTLRERSGKRFIRPVSARFMHEKEILAYEEDEEEIPPAQE